MKEIINYKLKDFIFIDEKTKREYAVALRFLKPVDTETEIRFHTLRDVEGFKSAFNTGDETGIIEMVGKVQGLSDKEIMELDIISFFTLLNSCKAQIKQISEAEKSLIDDYVDVKWEMVNGSERMAKFGIYNTLDNLTGNKPHLYDTYMSMQYSEIFLILLKRKTERQLQREMNEIKTK